MIKKSIIFILLMLPSLAFGNFYSPTPLVSTGPPPADGNISEAPFGGALITQFGTFTWGAAYPGGPPTYWVYLNGVLVDAGDELEIANSGNVYLWQNQTWWGPWTTVGGFGSSFNPSIHLPRIAFVPQIASNIDVASSPATVLTVITPFNIDNSPYTAGLTVSTEADGSVLSGSNIVVGGSGLPATPSTYIHSVAMSVREAVFDNSSNPWPFLNLTANTAYDTCGQGCAFASASSGVCNVDGSSYRTDYNNFKTDASSPSLFRIGCTEQGDRWSYIIHITSNGTNSLNLVASNGGGSDATVAVLIDGTQVGTITVAQTADYDTFATFTSSSFSTVAGDHVLTISCLTGESAFNGCGDMRTWQGI